MPPDDGALFEINAEFRRKLAGLRFLSRHARPAARREAREWRRIAIKALHEKRAAIRYADYRQRLQKHMRRVREVRNYRSFGA